VPIALFLDGCEVDSLLIYKLEELNKLSEKFELNIKRLNETKRSYERKIDDHLMCYFQKIYFRDIEIYSG